MTGVQTCALPILNKKDDSIPKEVKEVAGADVFYRNLAQTFTDHNLEGTQLTLVILGVFAILKSESIVDWHHNLEVKRIMANKLDDYLYDHVKGEIGVALSSDEIKGIVTKTMLLAENNHEIFGV